MTIAIGPLGRQACETGVNLGDDPRAFGMYGFSVVGLDDPEPLLVPVPTNWSSLEVVRSVPGTNRRRPAELNRGAVRFDEETAEVWISDTESIDIDRGSLQVHVRTHKRLSDDALAHPYLGLPAAVANRWLGRHVLHGGAFLSEGVAWGVLGAREAGKSSTLGWLHQNGFAILSDDLLVLDETKVFAGPRCVDLRDDAAAHIGGENLGVLGSRERWRLRGPVVPPSVRLAGLVHLAWGDEVAVEALTPSERLVALFEHYVFREARQALPLLDLAALPAWRLTRPRAFGGLGGAITQLLDAVAGG